MNRPLHSLLVLGGLVTVSALTSSVISGDVARTAAWLAAGWLITGLACLLVGLRRRRDRDRPDAP